MILCKGKNLVKCLVLLVFSFVIYGTTWGQVKELWVNNSTGVAGKFERVFYVNNKVVTIGSHYGKYQIVTFSEDGDSLWSRDYDIERHSLHDNEYLYAVAFENVDDWQVTKLDMDGNELWQKSYGNTVPKHAGRGNEIYSSYIEGNYIYISGYTFSDSLSDNPKGWWLKMSKITGDTVFSKVEDHPRTVLAANPVNGHIYRGYSVYDSLGNFLYTLSTSDEFKPIFDSEGNYYLKVRNSESTLASVQKRSGADGSLIWSSYNYWGAHLAKHRLVLNEDKKGIYYMYRYFADNSVRLQMLNTETGNLTANVKNMAEVGLISGNEGAVFNDFYQMNNGHLVVQGSKDKFGWGQTTLLKFFNADLDYLGRSFVDSVLVPADHVSWGIQSQYVSDSVIYLAGQIDYPSPRESSLVKLTYCQFTENLSYTPNSICLGDTVTLQATGSQTSWENLSGTGTAQVLMTVTKSFRAIQNYPATGCQVSKDLLVDVHTSPTVTVSSSDADSAICAGDDIILSGLGAVSYSWSNGVQDGVSFSLPNTQNFMVIGVDENGCKDTAEINILVYPLPEIVIQSSDENNEICFGDGIVLTGTGNASSYMWDMSIQNGVSFTPNTTNTYTLTGTNNSTGCTNSLSTEVIVHPLPNVAINESADTVCRGDVVTLSGTGAVTYSWDNGIDDGIPFVPVIDLKYTVVGTDQFGCSNNAEITVKVNDLPIIFASSNDNDDAICLGETITLSGLGGISYTWTDGVSDDVEFSPIETKSYQVVGTDVNGCESSDDILITVHPIPEALIVDNGTFLETQLLSNHTYQWYRNGVIISGAILNIFEPSEDGIYFVEVTNEFGCSNFSENFQIGVSGFEEFERIQVKIYPSPTNGLIHLEVKDLVKGEAKVFDMLGQQILQEEFLSDKMIIDLSMMPSGVYSILVGDENHRFVSRIVKY
ncbi:MAG: T9SS type A sorting domain-containing protein [Bacteroidetes bacterium]|nr:MAG: T9SS type A sorting domain-containing protein [Bacteroidota bacterium]